MRILYVHQFFAGPDAPGPAQPRALVRRLAERGHAVDVVACDLNAYNEQTEPEEADDVPVGGSVRVHRLPVPRGLRASLANRLKTYGRFAWAAYRFGRRLPKPDVVMASIQPLFGGFLESKTPAIPLHTHSRLTLLLSQETVVRECNS